eukprot:evm.model.scf_1432.4 EVM.evm.TU.scf_1432.4   scf_1432:16405-19070(+)
MVMAMGLPVVWSLAAFVRIESLRSIDDKKVGEARAQVRNLLNDLEDGGEDVGDYESLKEPMDVLLEQGSEADCAMVRRVQVLIGEVRCDIESGAEVDCAQEKSRAVAWEEKGDSKDDEGIDEIVLVPEAKQNGDTSALELAGALAGSPEKDLPELSSVVESEPPGYARDIRRKSRRHRDKGKEKDNKTADGQDDEETSLLGADARESSSHKKERRKSKKEKKNRDEADDAERHRVDAGSDGEADEHGKVRSGARDEDGEGDEVEGSSKERRRKKKERKKNDGQGDEGEDPDEEAVEKVEKKRKSKKKKKDRDGEED